MHRKGYRLQVTGYSQKIINIALALLITTTYNLPPPTSVHAQQAASSSAAVRTQTTASQTKKDVVRNFKINLSEYSSFGSDCSQKQKGDANCDTQINEFDLSIWEVEFNSINSPKRSDFNNDGVINLLDYGIWRNAFYPTSRTSQAGDSQFLSTLINLISKQSLERVPLGVLGHFLDQLGQLEIRNYFTAYAQESSSGGGEVNSSSTFTSESGNSLVINSISGGNTQQVNFDPSGNPQTASFFNPDGQSYAEVAFTNSGNTIIATQENGIPVTISKTASGPIIENFKNSDGSPLAIKSWPSQQSYDSNQPPIAVTIPGQGATKEVLNMQPNGDGIVEKLDAAGNILTRTQLRSNGTIVTEDFKNSTLVQSNTEVGFTNLSMKNNLGGQTQYMFYQGTLYAIVQSDAGNNSYISKPLNSSGASWSFETLEDGVKRSEKTTSDPILEAKSNTPNPQSLIQYINYYKQAQPDPNAITFSEGFTSTAPGIKNPVDKANAILTISQTQAPAVLGLRIIKEANAQASPVQRDPNSNTGGVWTEDKYTLADGTVVQINSNGTGTQITFHTGPGATVASPVNGGAEISVGRPDFGAMTGSSNQNAQAAAAGAWASALAAGKDTDQARADAVTAAAQATSNTSQPAAPAPPTDPAPPGGPAAPTQTQSCTGNCSAVHNTLAQFEAQKAAAGGIQDIASYLNSRSDLSTETKTETSNLHSAQSNFSIAVRNELASLGRDPDEFNNAVASGQHAGLKGAASSLGLDQSKLDQMEKDAAAQTGLHTRTDNGLGVPGISGLNPTAQDTTAAPPSSAAAAAAAAPGLPERGASTSLPGGFTSTITGYVDTNIRAAGLEGFASNIYDDKGNLVATQISTPEGRSDWTDVATGNTYTANSGALSAMTSDLSATGSIIGISASDHTSVVAVGDASYINAEGFIEGGRPATQEEFDAFQNQQSIQEETNPEATQISVSTGDLSGGDEARGEADNWGDSSTWGGPPSETEDAGPGDAGYNGNNIDQGGNFGGEQVGSQAGPDTTSDTSQSFSNDNFNNDTSNGSDANSSGADSSGW